ncbi:hypothetical protein OV203_06665 [Nannocystis sp. ILAH1]|uniref:hypothetical protein n=1 Tax=Nannocystis sp. ILAH1 TaxID=2996789 RepID=UPI00226E467F|nr:hypothetical protein [Nannocystis sp. ILAH1]MCY0986795.1 hypothetical protein [Nannocystis sp. ILAH1]
MSWAAFGCDVEPPVGEELAEVDEAGGELADAEGEETAEDAGDAEEQGDLPGLPDLTTGPRPSAGNYFTPVGTHDTFNCSKIAGWVKDGDTTAPTWVTIDRYAPYPYGEHVATVLADLYRGDLPFTDKYHGFSINTPASLKTGEVETIYIHGINVDANGNWDVNANSPLLSGTGKSVCCGTGCLKPDVQNP